jgi:formylglycine-generating enzyme required for sulfatase activity
MKRFFFFFSILAILTGLSVHAEGSADKAPAEPVEQHGDFVKIPGGTFTIGGIDLYGTESRKDPWPTVTISPFYMAMFPVTQEEFQEIMGYNPSFEKIDDAPVDGLSWLETVEYCNRLSQRDGLVPAYTINGENVVWNRSANGYRLPTEAEWEYACRAPTTSFSGERDKFGGLEHPWGLFVMPSDLYEWCWDWYAEYLSGTFTDPDGAASGIHRVMRGGVFFGPSRLERATMRHHDFPNAAGTQLFGFRLVRSSL